MIAIQLVVLRKLLFSHHEIPGNQKEIDRNNEPLIFITFGYWYLSDPCVWNDYYCYYTP